jgi:hypothetical protein
MEKSYTFNFDDVEEDLYIPLKYIITRCFNNNQTAPNVSQLIGLELKSINLNRETAITNMYIVLDEECDVDYVYTGYIHLYVDDRKSKFSLIVEKDNTIFIMDA